MNQKNQIKDQITVLDDSINYWKWVVYHKGAINSRNCACCLNWNTRFSIDCGSGMLNCRGCPIFEYTNKEHCSKTPYDKVCRDELPKTFELSFLYEVRLWLVNRLNKESQ
jgi:hypothetical protein